MTHSFKLAAAGAAILGQSLAGAALTDGLVAYYDMEDLNNKALIVGSNTTVTQLNLTNNGAAVGFAGNAAFNSDAGAATTDRSLMLAGAAANFSTSTGRLSTGYTSTQLLDGGTGFSIGMWTFLAMDPNAAGRRVFSYEAKDNFNISLGTSGNVTSATTSVNQLSYFTGNAGYATSTTPGSWNHVVQTYSNNGNNTYQVTTYVNGAFADARALGSTGFSFNGINIGNARDSANGRGWDGMIDEVVLYSRAIDQAEVSALYLAGVSASAIPEPSTCGLLGAGALAVVAAVRRRRRRLSGFVCGVKTPVRASGRVFFIPGTRVFTLHFSARWRAIGA